MKFYLASGLDNIESARFFRDGLVRAGHEQTYDWTQHGAVAAHGIERIREVAAAELRGVEAADFAVVVLPGGRGTHFEMGAAHAMGKPIFVYAPRLSLVDAHPDTCAFYHLPGVRTLWGDAPACLYGILRALDPKEHSGHLEPMRLGEPVDAYRRRFRRDFILGQRLYCPTCARTVLPDDLDRLGCPGCGVA